MRESGSFQLADDPADGVEVFSLIRSSALDPDRYVREFFGTGRELQQRVGDDGTE